MSPLLKGFIAYRQKMLIQTGAIRKPCAILIGAFAWLAYSACFIGLFIAVFAERMSANQMIISNSILMAFALICIVHAHQYILISSVAFLIGGFYLIAQRIALVSNPSPGEVIIAAFGCGFMFSAAATHMAQTDEEESAGVYIIGIGIILLLTHFGKGFTRLLDFHIARMYVPPPPNDPTPP